MSDTFNELKDIVKDLLGADESKITPEARFREELEADSLDLVELIMAFEDKFGTEISDEDAQKITTVGEAVSYISLARIVGKTGDMALLAEAVKEHFKVEVPHKDLQEIKSMKDLSEYIDKHKK